METVDMLVIGAGQAAMPLVFDLAKAGMRVALAERKYLGGSCVNFGCTPTKAAIASARVAHLARRGREFGLTIPKVEVDFPGVLEGARAIVKESRDGLQEEFDGTDNPILIRGHARFTGRNEAGFQVQIGNDTRVTAKQVVLDTGTRARIPKIDGLDTIPLLTADNWIDHNDLPEHLILLGGGYIGLEMGQFYRRMGSEVTILEHGSRLAEREDPEVSEALQSFLEAEGIVFHLGAEVQTVAKSPDGVSVTFHKGDSSCTVNGSHLFVAIGRTPNTDELGLETIGLSLKEGGIVPVDERLATPVPGVWAAGDIRGGPLFTHTSWDDFRILKSQITGDGSRTTQRNVPYAMFTDPQLGRVGLTETEARKAGHRIKIGHFDVRHNGHMREFRERTGFIKVVVDADTDRLLGASLLCDEAGELLHIYQMLMNADAPYTILRDAVIVHPTRAEAVQSATETVE